jgi:hypothetical protein
MNLDAWHDFSVALGGATAALAGLVFVAVSINVARIVKTPGLPGRAGESIVLLISGLVQCGLTLIPGQKPVTLGIELCAEAALAWLILMLLAAVAMRMPNRQPVSWHGTRLVGVQVSTLPVVLAGFSLFGWLPGQLNWFAAGVLAAVVTATGNAWVLLVEVVRDDRYLPPAES